MISTTAPDSPVVAQAVAALRGAGNWVLLVQTDAEEVVIFCQMPGDTPEDTVRAIDEFQQALVENFEMVRKGLVKREAP